ncbi:MAG: hypothetical protein Greene07147_242 [Parcubacteria group bacterium Greene0714_7]|nr:MAG: hypothetical protein Greene07147_242 [Parcubacteria group bacterium Greene0714_7]
MASPERKGRLDISEVPFRGRLASAGGFDGRGRGGGGRLEDEKFRPRLLQGGLSSSSDPENQKE